MITCYTSVNATRWYLQQRKAGNKAECANGNWNTTGFMRILFRTVWSESQARTDGHNPSAQRGSVHEAVFIPFGAGKAEKLCLRLLQSLHTIPHWEWKWTCLFHRVWRQQALSLCMYCRKSRTAPPVWHDLLRRQTTWQFGGFFFRHWSRHKPASVQRNFGGKSWIASVGSCSLHCFSRERGVWNVEHMSGPSDSYHRYRASTSSVLVHPGHGCNELCLVVIRKCFEETETRQSPSFGNPEGGSSCWSFCLQESHWVLKTWQRRSARIQTGILQSDKKLILEVEANKRNVNWNKDKRSSDWSAMKPYLNQYWHLTSRSFYLPRSLFLFAETLYTEAMLLRCWGEMAIAMYMGLSTRNTEGNWRLLTASVEPWRPCLGRDPWTT